MNGPRVLIVYKNREMRHLLHYAGFYGAPVAVSLPYGTLPYLTLTVPPVYFERL